MRHDFDLPRSEIERLIDEWIFREKDRAILKRRLLDRHIKFLGECLIGDTVQQMKNIVYKAEDRLFNHK